MTTSAPIHLLVKFSKASGDIPLIEQLIPDIPGESIAIGFVGQILLNSVDWEVERSMTELEDSYESDDSDLDNSDVDDAPVADPIYAAPSQLKFRKAMDLSTCQLLTALEKQRPLDLFIRIVDTSGLLFMTTVTVKRAIVVSYEMNGSSDATEGVIDESWCLEYNEIKFDYFPNAIDAAITRAMGGVSSAGFNWKPGSESKEPEGAKEKELEAQMTALAASQLPRFEEMVKKAREEGKKKSQDSVFMDTDE